MFGKSPEQKKKYIARIAEDVFFKKGFKESSLQDISSKGKLSKAGIYHYFKSKEEILFYILLNVTEEGIQDLKQRIIKNDSQELDPETAFKKLVSTYAHYLLDRKKSNLLVLRERHQLSAKNRKILVVKEKEIYNLLKSQLIKIPNLTPNINIQIMVFQIISMLHWTTYWFNENGELSRDEVIEKSIDLVFKGLIK